MVQPTQLLDGMVIFNELMKAGSFTRAAQTCGHSTSYMSKEISKLEARLGVRLLHRTTRALNLTPEGELYLQRCQQIIEDAVNVETMLAGHKTEPSGSLRVSCPASFDIPHLQQLFVRFMTRYPKVELDLDLSNRKVDMVAEGFDVLIRVSGQQQDSSLISRRILTTKAITLASPEYVQRCGNPTSPESLTNHHGLAYSYIKQPNVWRYENAQGEVFDVKIPCRAQMGSSQMLLAMCVAGQGIIRLPRLLLGQELENGQLVELLSDYRQKAVDVHVVYPSRKHLSATVQAFTDFVAKELALTPN